MYQGALRGATGHKMVIRPYTENISYICPNAPCPVTDKEDLCCLLSFPVASQTETQRVGQAVHLSCRPCDTDSACKMFPVLSEAGDAVTLYDFDGSKAVGMARQDESSSLFLIFYI